MDLGEQGRDLGGTVLNLKGSLPEWPGVSHHLRRSQTAPIQCPEHHFRRVRRQKNVRSGVKVGTITGSGNTALFSFRRHHPY